MKKLGNVTPSDDDTTHKCPDCGSSRIQITDELNEGTQTIDPYGTCLACGCVWEAFTRYDPDDEDDGIFDEDEL